MNLYTDTPLASAIFELFEKFNEKLVIHLNEAQTHGAIKAFIFGGCAIHLFTNVRGSDDVDIDELKALLEVFLGIPSAFLLFAFTTSVFGFALGVSASRGLS